jgi:hypothetical protein
MANISMKILKTVLNSADLPILMTGENTHTAALQFSASMVGDEARDELIINIVDAALPAGYTGNTPEELPGMITGARKKGFSGDRGQITDASDGAKQIHRPRKGTTQVALDATLELVELFHDERGRSYLSIRTDAGGRLCYEVDSELGRDVVQKIYYDASGGSALSDQKLKDVIRTLKARAKFEGDKRSTYRRVAQTGRTIYIDLGTMTGEAVQITGTDFSVVLECPVAFVRSATMMPLPKPEKGGSLRTLADILQIDEDHQPLLFGFLVNCVRGVGPYLCLLVEGPQGSGKSFLCGAVKKLIDPDMADRIRLPRDEQGLMLHAMNFFLPVYDNASGMRGDISDTLCAISTGAALVDRTLYTNEHVSVLRAQRPFVINGIADIVNRPDLLERAILLELKPLKERYSEADLESRLEASMPVILGALYEAVACALRDVGQQHSASEVRMADAARWITAAEPAIGVPSGSFVQALKVQQSEVAIERVSNEPIVGPLRSLLEGGSFDGSMQQLHVKTCTNHNSSTVLPQGPGPLSKLLKRLAPQLQAIDIHFEIKRTKKGSHVRMWKGGRPKLIRDTVDSVFQEATAQPLTFREKMAKKNVVLGFG